MVALRLLGARGIKESANVSTLDVFAIRNDNKISALVNFYSSISSFIFLFSLSLSLFFFF